MNQLLEYHVDKKEINHLIFERALKSYLSSADGEKIYLTGSEVAPYVFPSPFTLQKIAKDYSEHRYECFFQVEETIKKGIYRARLWRGEWEKNPEELVRKARLVKKASLEGEKKYAKSVEELKERYHTFFLQVIAVELKHLEVAGKEKEVVALCEKHLVELENPYLGIGEGKVFSDREQEHLVYLRILKAFSHSLDAHTAYYSPEEAYSMKVQLEKGMCGIGVVLKEGIDGVMIAELLVGGPAEKGGKLQVGDTIAEIDGERVKGYSFKKVLEILRGEEGSKTVLGVERKSGFQRVELTRSKITLEDKRVDVSYEPYGNGIIGKITLYSFYEGEDGISSEKDLRRAIEELKSKGNLLGLVLDLRENTGGFLSQAVRVSGLFISSGVVVVSKYSDGSLKYYRAVEGSRFYDGPLVLLISRSSASATEIVAQTLQDYGVAVVVGDHESYGKGTIQHQTVTADKSHSFFKVTIGKYYTVSGKSTQIEGVKADIVVPTELCYEKMGEKFLDYALPADQIAPCFDDQLTDLDVYAKRWFAKYYLPTLQKRSEEWQGQLVTLKKNSEERIKNNKNYQLFLKKIKKEVDEKEFGSNDLPVEESVNIVKDMILMKRG